MEALTSRLGTRFLIVTVVPNLLLIGYVALLLAAGAPAHSPSLTRAVKVLDGLTIRQVVVILLGVLVISVATHPLQTPLIQIVEGYWQGLPFGRVAANHFTERFRNELHWAQNEVISPQATEQSRAEARYRQSWLPPSEGYLLPTALGNTLWMGEIRAGERYGLDLSVALSRLAPLMEGPSLDDVNDRRNQLDAAVRLCVAAGLATAAGVGLLLRYGPWLFLPLATYLLCWMSYRAAVAAARGFCTSLAAAIDLNHLKLFDALQLERPANLEEEYDLNQILGMLFGDGLDSQGMANLIYVTKKTEESSAE